VAIVSSEGGKIRAACKENFPECSSELSSDLCEVKVHKIGCECLNKHRCILPRSLIRFRWSQVLAGWLRLDQQEQVWIDEQTAPVRIDWVEVSSYNTAVPEKYCLCFNGMYLTW